MAAAKRVRADYRPNFKGESKRSPLDPKARLRFRGHMAKRAIGSSPCALNRQMSF